jgi:pimeloyl-ACP methyl ester carboxylesterase
MPTVAVNGTELHYERRGAGEPLLMVMGMGGSHRHWGEPFTELIAHDFDAISYDHRGVGYSGRLDGALSIGRLATTRSACWTRCRCRVRTCSGSRWVAWSRRNSRCERRSGCAR